MAARPVDPESRRRPVYAAVALVLVIVAVLLAAGCIGGSRTDNRSTNLSEAVNVESELPVPGTPPIPSEKFSYIVHWTHTNGEKISGDCKGGAVFGVPRGFHFDKQKGVLKILSKYSYEINDSLILYYESGGNLSDYAGTGEDRWLFPVYSLPYTPHFPPKDKNVTIESVSGNGTILLRYNQEKISLKSKETWYNITSRYETREYNSTLQSGEVIHKNCTKKFVTTDSFYNSGILDKNSIVFVPDILSL